MLSDYLGHSGTHFQGHGAEQDPPGETASVKLNEHDPPRKEMPSFKQVTCKPSGFGRYPPELSVPACSHHPASRKHEFFSDTASVSPGVLTWESGMCWSLLSGALVLWRGLTAAFQRKFCVLLPNPTGQLYHASSS